MNCKYLIFIVLFWKTQIFSQEIPDYSLRSYTYQNGLPDEGLRDLFFDNTGKLWFTTTSSGIGTYDGKKFSKTTTDNGLSSNFTFRINQDKDGTIWVATNNGISRVNSNQKIDTFLTSATNERTSFFTNIAIDRSNTIYAMGFGGLYVFKQNKFVKVDIAPAQKVMNACNGINDNSLYFVTDAGILVYNNGKKEFINESKGLFAKNIYSITFYDKKTLLICGFSGLFLYDLDNKKETEIKFGKDETAASSSAGKLKDGKFLIAAAANKQLIFDGNTLKEFNTPVNDAVGEIENDPFGNIWMAGNTLHYLAKNSFTVIDTLPLQARKYQNIRRFGNTTILFGDNELLEYSNRKISTAKLQEGDFISSVFLYKGILYAGMATGNVYAITNGKNIKRIIEGNSLNNQPDIVQSFFADANNNIWVGRNYTVVKFNLEDQQAKPVTVKNDVPATTYGFAQGRNGILYAANGKEIFQLSDSIFIPYNLKKKRGGALSAIAVSPQGDISFGEAGKGLGIIQKDSSVIFITQKDGLPNTQINSIQFSEKEKNVCWINHKAGVSKIRFSNGHIDHLQNYTWGENGLTNTGSSLQIINDSVLLTDNTRVVYKNTNPDNDKAIISYRYLEGNSSSDSSYSRWIKLKDTTLVLERGGGQALFDFQSIDFGNRNATTYKYVLSGNGIQLDNLQDNGIISLGKLGPGEYVLKILAGNNIIELSRQEPVEIKIIIPAFWYQTNIFKFLLLLVLLAVIIWLTKRRIVAIEKRKLNIVEAQKRKIEIENKILRSQLDPHLVFNLLNNIQSNIIVDEKDTAIQRLNALSDLLKTSLELSKSPEIYLSDEIKYLQLYLTVESQRTSDIEILFSDTLSDKIKDCRVPALLWQPLIENAIKYSGGAVKRIEVSFTEENGWLKGSITNNYENHAGNVVAIVKGNGIRLVEERIKLLNETSGGDTAIFVYKANGGVFYAAVSISVKYIQHGTDQL